MSSADVKKYQHDSILILILLLCLFCLAACYGGGTEIGNPKVGMETFKSDQELEGYLKDQMAKSVLPDQLYVNKNDVPVNTGIQTDHSESFSRTNIQEQGVDESDKIKTDGKLLYITGNQKVTVADISNPADMRIESTITISGTVDEIFLYNDQLLVVLYFQNQGIYPFMNNRVIDGPLIGMPYWIPIQAKTNVAFYDVSNASHPTLIKDVAIEGSLVATRETGGKLHIVQQFMPALPPLEYSYDGTEAGRAKAISTNQKKLSDLTLAELLPKFQITTSNDEPIQSGRLIQSQNFYKPQETEGAAMVTVTSFDLDHLSDPMQSVGIIATAETIYASTRALYVSATNWNYDFSFAKNSTSKTETIIHKFDLQGETVRHSADGRINGHILNQFSLSEYDQVLRVATDSFSWQVSPQNQAGTNVFCLKEKDGELAVIGKIENIAPGEQLYAARFVDTRGFLVTFVRIDPLFTLDLSDPTAPKIAGELKVPGYSQYIHPFDQDYLLTLGIDVAEKNGVLTPNGIQLSIFDVKEFTDPRLLFTTKIEDQWAYTEAMYNHKAFAFFPEQHLLALPINWGSGIPYRGLEVYRVTPQKGFEKLGRITDSETSGIYSNWLRGLFVDDNIFAVLGNAVYTAKTEDIQHTIKKLIIPEIPTYRAVLKTKSMDGIEKQVFNQGEPIVFSLTYQNLTNQNQLILLRSTQQYEIEAYDSKDYLVWNWSRNKIFSYVLTDLNFAPNEIKTFEETWDQKDNNEQPIAVGNYNLFANRNWYGEIYTANDLSCGPVSVQIVSDTTGKE